MIPANKLPPSMGGGGFTLFSGPANPLNAMGEDMDWYIQTTNGQFWQRAGGAWLLRYTDQLGQAGGGITETQARGLIADWAETGNTDNVPSNKLPSSTATVPGVAQGVTNTEIDTEAGNTRLTWSVTHVRRLIERLTSFGAGVSSAISDVAAAGTDLVFARHDHGHNLPTDSTIAYDDTAETFGVSVHNVIEALQERIQYHTNSSDYSSSAGATVGQAYATSQYRKIITKVEVLLNPLVGADAYLVRLDELNADNSIKAKLFTSQTRSAPFGLGTAARAFNFHDADGGVGVNIDGGIRLGILISRLGDNSDSAVAAIHGAEAANSPRKSYDDASVDFDLENGVVYQHIDPGVGASTHSHDTQIRGNIKIFYTLVIDHGDLVSGLTADEVDARIEAWRAGLGRDGEHRRNTGGQATRRPQATARGAPSGLHHYRRQRRLRHYPAGMVC